MTETEVANPFDKRMCHFVAISPLQKNHILDGGQRLLPRLQKQMRCKLGKLKLTRYNAPPPPGPWQQKPTSEGGHSS